MAEILQFHASRKSTNPDQSHPEDKYKTMTIDEGSMILLDRVTKDTHLLGMISDIMIDSMTHNTITGQSRIVDVRNILNGRRQFVEQFVGYGEIFDMIFEIITGVKFVDFVLTALVETDGS